MKKYFIIKKIAVITGFCLIGFSILLFISTIIISNFLSKEYLDDLYQSLNAEMHSIFKIRSSLSFLINGFSLGIPLIVLGYILNPEKCASFKNLKKVQKQ